MPTSTGLPKPGEIWRRTYRLPEPGGAWKTHTVVFHVKERTAGSYWSLRVDVLEADGTLMTRQDYNVKNALWVDPANWLRQGELEFVRKSDGRPWAQQRQEQAPVVTREAQIRALEQTDRPHTTRDIGARASLHRKLVEALTYVEVLYCDQGEHEGMLRLELRAGARGTNVYLTADEVAVFKGRVL